MLFAIIVFIGPVLSEITFGVSAVCRGCFGSHTFRLMLVNPSKKRD